MARGTKVGDAYIEIHGDNREWIKATRNQRKAWTEAGQKDGEAWAKGLDDVAQGRVARSWKRLQDSIVARDFSGQERQWGSIEEAVRRVNAEMEDLNKTGTDGVKLMTDEQKKFARQRLNDWANERRATEAQLATMRRLGDLSETHRTALLENAKITKERTKEIERQAQQVLRSQEREAAGYDRVFQRASAHYRKLKELKTDAFLTDADVAEVRRLTDDMLRGHVRLERGLAGSYKRMSEDRDTLFLGRLKGSRNDFLNIVGSIFVPLERAMARVFEGDMAGRGPLDNLFSLLNTSEGGGARTFFGQLRTLAAGILPRLAAMGPVAAVGIGLIGRALEVGISAIANFAGIALGLVSTLGSGLSALAVFALPIVGGLAAAIGTVIVGIQGMTDEMKAQLTPISDWYKELKPLVAENLFGNLADQVGRLMPLLDEFVGPLLQGVATEISAAIDDMVTKFTDPAFMGVLSTLEDTLPGIVGGLGATLNSIITGITGVMAAVAPQVEIIVGKISTAVENWSSWVSSPEGQNTIADWFTEAWEAATLLWNLGGALIDVLGTLFSMGDDTGNTWVEGWIESLGEFSAWLQSDEGRDSFNEWMERAKQLASDLGDLVDDIAFFFDAFNTEVGTDNTSTVLDFLGKVFVFAGWAAKIGTLSNELLNLHSAIGLFSGSNASAVNIYSLAGAFENLTGIDITGWLDDWFAGLSEFDEKITAWVRDTIAGIGKWIAEWYIAGGDLVAGFINGIIDRLIPEEVQAAFRPIIDWVKSLFGIASPSTVFMAMGADVVQGFINGLLSLSGALLAAAASLFQPFIDVVLGMLPPFVTDALALLAPLVPGTETLGKSLAGTAETAMRNTRTKFTGEARKVPGEVGAALAPITAQTAQQITRAMQAGAAAFRTYGRLMVTAAGALASQVAARLAGLYSVGFTAGANAGRGLAAGLASQAGAVRAQAAGLGNAVKAGTNAALISRSPSRAMMLIGENAAAGLIIGMESMSSQVNSAAQGLAESITSAFDPTRMRASGAAAGAGFMSGLPVMTDIGLPNASSVGNTFTPGPDDGPDPGTNPYFGPGSIIVQSPAANGTIVAEQVVDQVFARAK
jgi:hypothetical protein